MSLIDEIHGALRPKTDPITATLDEAEEATDSFESVSSLVPVSFLVIGSVDFAGSLVFEMLIGETWHHFSSPIINLANEYVPEGAQVRARLASVSAGFVDVTIFQGRT